MIRLTVVNRLHTLSTKNGEGMVRGREYKTRVVESGRADYK